MCRFNSELDLLCLTCRGSGRSSAQDPPRLSGLSSQQKLMGEFNTESVQAMKAALRRFSSDKDLKFEPAQQQGQEQLDQSIKPSPRRSSFSRQIRASFERSGDAPQRVWLGLVVMLIHCARSHTQTVCSQANHIVITPQICLTAGPLEHQRLPKTSHIAPDSTVVYKSHSVTEGPSSSTQIAASLPIRNHTLGTTYVPALFVNTASQGQTHAQTLKPGRPPNEALPQPMGRAGRSMTLNGPPLSAVEEGLDPTSSTTTVANPARGKSMPIAVIQQTSLNAFSQSPVKLLNTSAAVQIAQKSASLSRRASLAAKLQRMADNADTRSMKASEAGSPASLAAPTKGATEDGQSLAHATIPTERKMTSLDKVSRADCKDSAPTTQQTSHAVDRKAADVRRQHLSSLEQAVKLTARSFRQAYSPSNNSPQAGNPGPEVSHAQTAEEPGITPMHAVKQTSSSASESGIRRTLSDAASEALDAVENMQCPIIAYSQLHIQRKLGDGSIGQVYAS